MTTIYDAVKEICLSFAETEAFISHGYPNFKVRGKGFATYSVNHHGDNKVALLLNSSVDNQQMLVSSAPKIFFVPPYVGPKGWLGIELNQGLAWSRVAQLTHQAYQYSAPDSLARASTCPTFTAPDVEMKPEDINPLLSRANQDILKKLRKLCLALPEVNEDAQFGDPCFRAGKKSFCGIGHSKGHTRLQIWVGAERQLALTAFDKRFSIPAYMGKNGWINLDLSSRQNWQEIESLLLESYRHFALKRMLNALVG